MKNKYANPLCTAVNESKIVLRFNDVCLNHSNKPAVPLCSCPNKFVKRVFFAQRLFKSIFEMHLSMSLSLLIRSS